MPLPPDLQRIIDEDLSRIREALERTAPAARLVLAGSLAFDEPWAWRGTDGGWVLESDYDLYLVVPSLAESLALSSAGSLRGLGATLGTRAPVDPYVVWKPLLDRGVVGMVGRWLDSGAFVDCALDPHSLRVNQARKALVRQRLLAPRETPERARYQRMKAAIEALRAVILGQDPAIGPRALFSLRANQRWLNSGSGALEEEDRATLAALLAARLELADPCPQRVPWEAVDRWLERFASVHAPEISGGARRRGRPTTTTLRAWASWLRRGLPPRPGLDYDALLLAMLADPLCAELAERPAARAAFEQRWRHAILAPWLPRRRGALIRAVDGALGNPASARGERYLIPGGDA